MSNYMWRIVCIAAVGVFASALTVQGAADYDLSGDNADISVAGGWNNYLNDSSWPSGEDYVQIGVSDDNPGTWTGYLDSTYDSTLTGLPDDGRSGSPAWAVKSGHLEFRNNAIFNLQAGHSFQVRNTAHDPTLATVTVKQGASFTNSATHGLQIGNGGGESGTFTVNGGNVTVDDDVVLAGLSSDVALFEVVGSGGSITINGKFQAAASDTAAGQVRFELDGAGDVTVVDANVVGLYDSIVDLKVDTSAFSTESGSVDLFNYGNLWQEQGFGDVTVLDGSNELKAGNGTAEMTYNLDYGAGWTTTDATSGTISLTYNNVPEPSSLFLLGLAGLLLMKGGRRRRV